MNEKEKKKLKDVLEENGYILQKCADNLEILSYAIHANGDHVYSNAVEAVAELVRIVANDLLNNVWPNMSYDDDLES